MTVDEGISPQVGRDVDRRSPAVSDQEWRVIRAEFQYRRVAALRRKLRDSRVDVRGIDDMLGRSSRIADVDAATEELASLLLPVWNSLAARPADCVLLSVFGYARCQLAWELSADEEPIVVGIRGLLQSWERSATRAGSPARSAVDLVVAHAQSLLPCVRAENAVKCSCPVELETQAALVATESAMLLGRSAGLPAEWAGFRDEFLAPVLRSHQLTYHGLCEAARSVIAWAGQGRAAAPALQQAMRVIEQAERDPSVASDVYASELRGHRAGLHALHERISDPGVPDIQITQAKLVYCYPFSIPGLDGEEVCQRAGQLAPGCFGPRRAFAVAETDLSDLWNAQGRQDPVYCGVSVALPEVTVQTTSGDILTDHSVTIRLSRLGNHYVRIEKSITDCTLHELNQAMRRASPYMGLETVTESGGAAGPWRQLPEYVRELADRFCRLVRPENAADGASSPAALATDADFHVLVKITSAAVTKEDGTVVAATTADVLTAAGPLLCAPLQSLPSTLEEWARFGALSPGDSGLPVNLVDSSLTFPGDFVGRTFSSTCIVMLDTPNWMILGYEEQAEFVASLGPLIEGWRSELVRAIEAEQADKLHLRGSGELSERRLALQDRVRRIQDQVALLHSIDLWKTLSSRRFGESLYTASGLDDVEAELTQTITRVELYYERLAALISQNEERRDRRYQTLVELILSLLAVASLADLLSLLNSLFGLHGRVTAWWEIGVLLTAMTVVGTVMGMLYKLRD